MSLIAIKNISPKNFEKELIISTGVFSIIFLLDKFHLINLGISTLSDNFIKQIYGHSYLADLLVLTIPFLINKTNQKSTKLQKYINYVALLFFFLILIITNSRSGVIAVAIGVLFLHSNSQVIQKIIKTSIVILALTFLIISLSPKYQNKFDKTTTGERDKYWSLAFNGFTSSPIFGNGPNTFPIIRRQNQTQAINTNLTHSSILNFLCENGIIFTIIFFTAIFYGLKKNQTSNNVFFVSSLISVIHSFLDPTWNSPGIFIISLYLIFYYSDLFKEEINQEKKEFPTVLALALFCFIFFILDTISTQFFIKNEYRTSLIFNPFNLDSRLGILTTVNPKNDIWQKNLDFTLKYFSKNEIVYQKLITVTSFPQNEEYYYQLFSLDPKEAFPYYLELVEKAKNNNDKTRLERVLTFIDKSFKENEMASIYAIPISKESYQYAIDLYSTDKNKAISFFQLSVKLFPVSGFYQVDLANALWNSNQNKAAINQLSNQCQKYPQAKDQCKIYLDAHQNKDFNQPGTEEYIKNIDKNI